MSHASGPNPNHPSSSELSSVKTSEDNNNSGASSRLSVAGTLSTVTKLPAMIDEQDIEDGPLFRATITELEGRTSALKSKMKRILKSATASLEAKRISLEADEEFVRALRDVSTADPLFKYYLDDAWPKMFEQRERLLHSMQSLLIDPLKKLYEMDIKMADTKRRQFEDVSKDYYASLAKYLSLKTDSSKRQDAEAKHVAKQRNFDLVRFNYYAFLVDLHGGKKEQEILYHLLSYQQKEYAFYQSVASAITPSKIGLDDLAAMMADISREQNIVNKERYEKRKMLESKVAEAGSNVPTASESLQKKVLSSPDQRSSSETTGSLLPPSITLTNREETAAADVLSLSSDDETPMDKFRGYRDLQQQNRELQDTGRRKEGFLFAVSKPSKNVAIDKSSASTWHKYWCVLVGGQLHEYSNWKGQLQRHIEPINLKFATAREARSADRRFCFEVITRDLRRVYQATSQEEMESWIVTINNAIQSILNGYGSAVDLNKNLENAENEPVPEPSTSKKKDRGKSLRGALRSGLAREKYLKKRHSHSGIENAERLASLAATATSAAEAKLKWPGLNFVKHGAANSKQSQQHVFPEAADMNTELLSTLRQDPSNMACADCGAANPDWCSLNLGILLCIECSGIHRSLGTHISKVRSLTLDSTSYTPDIIALLRAIGNARANAVWAAGCDESAIKSSDTREVKLKHIQAKYVERAFTEQLPEDLNAQQLLFQAIDSDDIPAALYAVAVGANVNGARPASASPRIYLLSEDEEEELGVSWRESNKPSSSSRVSHTTAATTSDTQSTNGIDIEGIKADLDASYYTVRYPLHFALLHGRAAIECPERHHVYPMAEFLLQNGADTFIRDPATGCLLSELVGLGSLVEDEALEYVNTKIAARGQAQIARSSMPPPPPVHVINSSNNSTSNENHTS